ncbi:hypothetical protein [Streptomyces sp. LMG1-1-1.1]|uniref:hypothetical protein n=1 Tax=Streptomyces sp. LMG1-1-1.1 TaxID=3135245 RepID=UPI003466A8FF
MDAAAIESFRTLTAPGRHVDDVCGGMSDPSFHVLEDGSEARVARVSGAQGRGDASQVAGEVAFFEGGDVVEGVDEGAVEEVDGARRVLLP